MNIVGNKRDGLTILPVLLDAKGDFQLLWELSQITVQFVSANEGVTFIVEFPVDWNEGFYDAFTRWVFVLIKSRLRFLGILSAAQASYSDECKPI
jgi:hypothetical protein